MKSRFPWLITVFLSCLLAIPSWASPPPATQIMQELKTADPQAHTSIYQNILEDTSVLSHSGLQRELVRLADEVWYERYLRGNIEQRPGAKPLEVSDDFNGSFSPYFYAFRKFNEVAIHLNGIEFVKTTLKILPGTNITPADIYYYKLKKRGVIFLRYYLKLSNFSRKSNKEYRLMTSTGPSGLKMHQVLYETYKNLNDKGLLKKNLLKRLHRYSSNIIQANEDTPIPKEFGVAFLLDQGKSLEKIKSILVQPTRDRSNVGAPPVPSERITKAIFTTAQKWRDEYPKWPVEDVKTTLPEDFELDGETDGKEDQNRPDDKPDRGKRKGPPSNGQGQGPNH